MTSICECIYTSVDIDVCMYVYTYDMYLCTYMVIHVLIFKMCVSVYVKEGLLQLVAQGAQHPRPRGGGDGQHGLGNFEEVVPGRVFGGPWDVVSTYNWAYNPTCNDKPISGVIRPVTSS